MKRLEQLMELARAHGEQSPVEDGATHEVGDLQMIARAAWRRLTPQQREEAYAEVSDNLLHWIPGTAPVPPEEEDLETIVVLVPGALGNIFTSRVLEWDGVIIYDAEA